jgi:hypothetical protein
VLRGAGELAHLTRGSGERLRHPRRPALEGGGMATPVSSWNRCRAQRKGKRAGPTCSPHGDASKISMGEERATAAVISVGGGSGGASAGRNKIPKCCMIW